MVVVDFDGHVMRYDQLTVMESVVAAPASTLEIEVPGPRGKGWRRTDSSIDTAEDPELDDEWRKDLSEGARHMREETWIKASDYHYDAKCFPAVHPHGTGSLSSEPGTGGPRHYAKSRLCSIEQFFRRSALWGFWMMDRIIKTQMFWVKRKREEKKTGARAIATEADAVERLYGTVLPASIPETTSWWRRQSKDLLAMSEDAEMGLMQAMLTQSHNDSSPEMLAAVRRGPCSPPTNEEMIEYLLTRKRRDQDRPAFEHFSAEHVLSYQRRIQATKKHFEAGSDW